MDVPSWRFLIAAVAVAIIYNLHRSAAWRSAVLLLVNLAFLATFAASPVELLPYAGFLVLGLLLIRLVGRDAKGAVQAGAVISILLVFFWLKQYTFLPERLFLQPPYVVVGLSYFFFRVLHLVIDARDDRNAARIPTVDYLNFSLNFTALISGPIQRYEDYRETALDRPLPLGLRDLGAAMERIVTGLFKIKVVTVGLSAAQHAIAPEILSDPSMPVRAADGMLLAALFPIYLYFNFSGYTDFVIGVARLLRIRLPENFDRPFTSVSFIEYWSRWHMSLSNWLKTYVYNPLMTGSMRRVRDARTLPYIGAGALFITFFLIGAWHGRTSNFLFFGLLNGAGVAVNQAYRIVAAQRLGRKRFAAISATPAYRFFGRGLTFVWVAFTLLWFWSDWPELTGYARAITGPWLAIGWTALTGVAALALAGLMAGEAALLRIGGADGSLVRSRYVRTVLVTLMLTCIVAVQSLTQSAAPDIVYKDF